MKPKMKEVKEELDVKTIALVCENCGEKVVFIIDMKKHNEYTLYKCPNCNEEDTIK